MYQIEHSSCFQRVKCNLSIMSQQKMTIPLLHFNSHLFNTLSKQMVNEKHVSVMKGRNASLSFLLSENSAFRHLKGAGQLHNYVAAIETSCPSS